MEVKKVTKTKEKDVQPDSLISVYPHKKKVSKPPSKPQNLHNTNGG